MDKLKTELENSTRNGFCQDKSQKYIFTFKMNAALISFAHNYAILYILLENFIRRFVRRRLILPKSHFAWMIG